MYIDFIVVYIDITEDAETALGTSYAHIFNLMYFEHFMVPQGLYEDTDRVINHNTTCGEAFGNKIWTTDHFRPSEFLEIRHDLYT